MSPLFRSRSRKYCWIALRLMALGVLLSQSSAVAAQDQPVRTLLLVRHGAYDEAAADNAHASLTPLGIAQARLVAARLHTLPRAPAVLISSTVTRAEQTAAIVHEALSAVPEQRSDLLRECTPPVSVDIKLSGPEPKAALACQQQIDQAFETYFRPASQDETDILVCHGNVIRYLVAKALGIDTRLWAHFSVGHTSVTEIQVRADGTTRIFSVGDVGHLPFNLQSGTGAKTPDLKPPQMPQ